MLAETIPLFDKGKVVLKQQEENNASYAGRFKKEDGLINWNWPATAIHNLARALQPWPGVYTFCEMPKQGRQRIEIIATGLADCAAEEKKQTGIIEECKADGLIVRTGEGCLKVKKVKPAGKKVLDACDFINGYHLKAGGCFGC